METYEDLYRERQDWKQRMRKIQHDKSQWREYVELSDKVKTRTAELKRLAAIKPETI